MPELEGFPYFEVEFTRDGGVFRDEQVRALLDALAAAPRATDLLVLSHGWNNDAKEARELYTAFLGRFGAQAAAHPDLAGARRFAVLAVLWPSKRFADSELIAGGGAASVGGAGGAAAELTEELEGLKGFFDAPDADERLTEAQRLVPLLEDSPRARREFADLLRALPALGSASDDERDDRAAGLALDTDGDEVITALSAPDDDLDLPAGGGGGAAVADGGAGGEMAGDAAGVGAVLGGIVGGARRLANLVTYYQMKERAGRVGARGLSPVLCRASQAGPGIRVHLVGHSFGGRLVTAAAAGLGGCAPPFAASSMTLLQAAFSHNGFAKDYEPGKDGSFRAVVTEGRVSGPILITHTRRDRAVGWAYAVASRLARQNGAALGDANDPFGGIGSNGAQHTPEATAGLALLAPGERYQLAAGRLHNLKGDQFISGHSDVASDATAYAVLSAVAAAG